MQTNRPLKVKKKGFAAKLAEKRKDSRPNSQLSLQNQSLPASQVSLNKQNEDPKEEPTENGHQEKNGIEVKNKTSPRNEYKPVSRPKEDVIHVSTKERRIVISELKEFPNLNSVDESKIKELNTNSNSEPKVIKLPESSPRLRSHHMKESTSLESLQNSPFTPKPPTTPRKTLRKTSSLPASDSEETAKEKIIINAKECDKIVIDAQKNDTIVINSRVSDTVDRALHQRWDSLPNVGQASSDITSHVSNRSLTGFPVMSIQEARSRILSDKDSSYASMLMGPEELERYFPDRQLHIWLGSWNMGEVKNINTPMTDFLLPESSKYVQNMYIIGTQENAMNKKEWEIVLQDTLGPSFVLFHSVSHGSLHLAIFIHRDLIWFCSLPDDDHVSTRAVTMVKTKGAIAISLTFFGTSLLFINSHLTSDQSKNKDRISDYEKIITGLKLPKSSKHVSPDVTANFDCVYWCGDLNFRIERKKTVVEKKVLEINDRSIQNYEDLIRHDQLTQIITEGKIFRGFQEGRITFPPTYKYDIDSNQFDTSNKNRIPSYTDRILFRSKVRNHISCLDYSSVMSVAMSDHKPVYGVYQMAIKPSKELVTTAAGHFDKEVYIKANQKLAMRHANQDVRNEKSSVTCSIQ